MTIQSITPQLRTTDLEATIRFYVGVLGFSERFRFGDFYAEVALGEQQLHLKLVDDADPSIEFVRTGEHLHFYLRVDDVAAFAARLVDAGVQVQRTVHETAWGTREVIFEDDQGHRLVAGQANG